MALPAKRGRHLAVPENKMSGEAFTWRGRRLDASNNDIPVVAFLSHFFNEEDGDPIPMIYTSGQANGTGTAVRVPRVVLGLGGDYAGLFNEHDDVLGPLGVLIGTPKVGDFSGGVPLDGDMTPIPAEKFIGGEAAVLLPLVYEFHEGYSGISQSYPAGDEEECGEGNAGIDGLDLEVPNAIEDFTYTVKRDQFPLVSATYRARFSRLLVIIQPPSNTPPFFGNIDLGHTCTIGGELPEILVVTGHRTYESNAGSRANHAALTASLSTLFGGDHVTVHVLPSTPVDKPTVVDLVVQFFS